MTRLHLKPVPMALMATAMPSLGWAHGFGERYDLPIPMTWVIAAACCVVLLSFLLTPFIQNPAVGSTSNPQLKFELDQPVPITGLGLSAWQMGLKCVSVGLLLLTGYAAMWGSGDALMNFAPTFIWIIWWLGASFACIMLGNVWHHIDPWLAIYQFASYLLSLFKTKSPDASLRSEKIRLAWPSSLARWPACAMLLCWCAIEIIYPIASMPHRVGVWAALYSLGTWAGMCLFGPSAWRQHADGFSLYFELTGQARNMLLKKNLQRHDNARVNTAEGWSTVGLVIAVFTSVLFDGLHAGPAWLVFEKWASRFAIFQSDLNGYLLGAMGLVLVWLFLFGMHVLTCWVTHRLMHWTAQGVNNAAHPSTLALSNGFLSSLMPIAMAYLVAHNFSAFVIQGQNILALASDPMGWGWNLWGTAHYYPDIELVDAKLTWYVATVSIVLGHVMSVLMAHRVACQYCLQMPPKQTMSAWVLNIPMTLVMIGFTALSLTLIAEPLVNT